MDARSGITTEQSACMRGGIRSGVVFGRDQGTSTNGRAKRLLWP